MRKLSYYYYNCNTARDSHLYYYYYYYYNCNTARDSRPIITTIVTQHETVIFIIIIIIITIVTQHETDVLLSIAMMIFVQAHCCESFTEYRAHRINPITRYTYFNIPQFPTSTS